METWPDGANAFCNPPYLNPVSRRTPTIATPLRLLINAEVGTDLIITMQEPVDAGPHERILLRPAPLLRVRRRGIHLVHLALLVLTALYIFPVENKKKYGRLSVLTKEAISSLPQRLQFGAISMPDVKNHVTSLQAKMIARCFCGQKQRAIHVNNRENSLVWFLKGPLC
jgi:hypothetical protein